jgi:hypothetical protein
VRTARAGRMVGRFSWCRSGQLLFQTDTSRSANIGALRNGEGLAAGGWH